MKYFMIAAASLALVACGGAKDKAADAADKASDAVVETATDAADAVEDTVDGALNGMSKSDWISACSSTDQMTVAQCECTLDAYDDIGIAYADLDDADKLAESMGKASPDQLAALGACMN